MGWGPPRIGRDHSWAESHSVGGTKATSSQCRVLSRSAMSDSASSWTVARQALLSVGFSRQEFWSGLPSPPPGDLPNLEIEPRSPALQADSLLSESPGKPTSSQTHLDSVLLCPVSLPGRPGPHLGMHKERRD